jgi:hypothetical protein
LDKAIALYNETLSLHLEWPVTGQEQCNIALAELQKGQEPPAVAARYEQVFRRASESGPGHVVALSLHGLGLTAARAGQDAPAVRVLGAAIAVYEELGWALALPERLVHEETLAQLRTRLGEDAFAAAWEAGRELSPQAAN